MNADGGSPRERAELERERRLFELCFEPDSLESDDRAALEAEFDPAELERERLDLDAFLSGCRADLAGELEHSVRGRAAAGALAESILDATTREDLSWRGDLRLVGGFVRRRWDSSLLVRLVAASLVLHVAALPVVGFMILLRPEEPQVIKFEAPPESIFGERDARGATAKSGGEQELVAPLGDLQLPEVVEVSEVEPTAIDPRGGEVWEEARASALAWARYHLREGLPSVAADGTVAAELLAARSRLARGLSTDVAAPAADAACLEHALWAEYLLDRYVLEGQVPSGFADALTRLAPSNEREELLALATLARADAYGLLLSDEEARVARLRERALGTEHAELARRLTGDSTRRPGAPVDRDWLAALELAADEAFRTSEFGRAWTSWGE